MVSEEYSYARARAQAAAEGDRSQPARPLRVLEPEPLNRRLLRPVRDVRRRRRGRPRPRSRNWSRSGATTSRSTHPSWRPSSTRGSATGPRRWLSGRPHADRGHRPDQHHGRGISGVRLASTCAVATTPGCGWPSGGYDYIARGAVGARDGLRRVFSSTTTRPLGLVRAACAAAPERQAGRARAGLDQDARRSRTAQELSARIDEGRARRGP